MGAIVRVAVDPQAFEAFSDVVSRDGVLATELGMNSGMWEVVFASAEVEIGTGLETLRRRMDSHTPGSSEGVRPVILG
jgi:hypothetical protein